MVAPNAVEYVTDIKGKKKKVVLNVNYFEKIQEEIEDLEDALALEKAKREATGFKKWRNFIIEIETFR
jgi:HPt (histidine-containing phosphotransfer) domain-containing protein